MAQSVMKRRAVGRAGFATTTTTAALPPPVARRGLRRRRPHLAASASSAAASAGSAAPNESDEPPLHWSLAPYDAREQALVDRLLSSPLDDLMAEARAVRDVLWPGDTQVAVTAAAADDGDDTGGGPVASPRPSPSALPLLPRPITFSPKVFIPLTRACRDACAYCTFAQPPIQGRRVYMTLDEVAAVAAAGAASGCTEALLTLGDQPEARWPEAAAELQSLGGFSSTLEYVEAACARVLASTGLVPHVNAGIVGVSSARRLKRVCASQGLMLEGVDPRLNHPGAAHDASTCPDKLPSRRLRSIEAAGEARAPFTTGVLVGIGESRAERLRALVAIARLHARHGHVQEAIVQNFVPKSGTGAEAWPPPSLEELLWSVACARLILPPDVSVQAPPNLTPPAVSAAAAAEGAGAAAGGFESDAAPPPPDEEAALEASWRLLLEAGINDWGGVSPLTRDWVNPDRPWPHVAALARATAAGAGGRPLLPRLPVYPRYALLGGLAAPAAADKGRGGKEEGAGDGAGGGGGEEDEEEEQGQGRGGWLSEAGGVFSVAAAVRRHSDATGLSRGLGGWFAGVPDAEDAAAVAAAEEEAGADWAAAHSAAAAAPASSRAPEAAAAADHHAGEKNNNKGPAPGGLLGGRLPSSSRPPGGGGWAVALDAYGGTLSGLPPPSQVSPPMRALLARLLDPERDAREPAAAAAAAASGGGPSGGGGPSAREVEALLSARGADAEAVRAAADALRHRVCGDEVTYVVNRNLNYTNVCTYGCTFCGFSKARPGEEDGEAGGAGAGAGAATRGQRDPAYVVSSGEVSRRAAEAWGRGATEICMQGGIHPSSTGEAYLELLRAAKRGAPRIHAHAFSPLEVAHGAATLGLSVECFLLELRSAGLGSLPGTAAEILHDEVRGLICPDKLSAAEWCEVMEAAAAVARAEEEQEEAAATARAPASAPTSPPPDPPLLLPRRPPPLRATATMMFGHVDSPAHCAQHLLLLRGLQARTRGFFTEFVPLPFVSAGAPAYARLGQARRGPTLREAVLAHAAARLVLHPHFRNIQASWVKMGPLRASGVLLSSGCNDMGGTLMQESITRASGASHGQELGPREMGRLISRAPGGRRTARQRTTTYHGEPEAGQVARSLTEAGRAPLAAGVKMPAFAGGGGVLEAAGLIGHRTKTR